MTRVRPRSRSDVLGAVILAFLIALPVTACATADQPATSSPDQAPAVAEPVEPVAVKSPVPVATPSALATFTVSGLMVEGGPEAIRPGDVVTVSARVQNTGNAPGTYEALLMVDGSLAGRRLADVAAGQSAIVRIPVQIRGGGRYDIQLGDQQLALLVAAPAAFTLGTLEVTPNPADAGDRVTVRVTVANTGGETGTQVVRLRIDGKLVGTKEPTIAGGAQATVEFSVAAPGAGRHTVSAGELETRLVVWKIARQPNGKVLVNKLKGGYGKLTVRNRGELDAVFVFVKPSAPKKALLAVYVRAGKSATVTGIKDGSYAVFYTLGNRWDAHGRVFTASLERRRFDDRIRFRTTRTSTQIHYVTWTLTLQARSGGNAPTTWVGESDFPGVP